MSSEVFKKALKNLTEEDIRKAEEQIVQIKESRMEKRKNESFDVWNKIVHIDEYVSYVKKSGVRKMGRIILISKDGLRVDIDGMQNAGHVNWHEIQEVGTAPIVAETVDQETDEAEKSSDEDEDFDSDVQDEDEDFSDEEFDPEAYDEDFDDYEADPEDEREIAEMEA